MKICFISLKAYPLFNTSIKAMHGGAEVQISLLAKELAKDKTFKVTLMCADYGQKHKELIDGVKVYKTFNFKLFTLLKYIIFIKCFFKVNADVYVQRTLSPYSFFIALLCKLQKKKFIYMVAHDDELNKNDRLYACFFGRFFAQMLFEKAHTVVVQNEHQKQLLLKNFPLAQGKILKKYVAQPDILTSSNKIYDCLWIARAEHWKQPALFFELATRNPLLNFLMICPNLSKKFSKADYELLIEKASKLKNLRFIEHVGYAEIFTYLHSGKVFCCTSTAEGDLPMSILEAAVVGLPILLLSINNYIENPEENGIGIHCQNDIAVMSLKLNECLQNPEKHNEFSGKAKAYVQTHHHKDKVIESFKRMVSLQ